MSENLIENNLEETEEPVSEPKKPKKKIKKRYIFGGIGIALALSAVFLALFNPVVKNYIRKLTKSETEYFRIVEKENFSATSEMISGGYASLLYSFFGNQNYLLSGDAEMTSDFANKYNLPFESGLIANAELNYIRKKDNKNLSLAFNIGEEDFGILNAEIQEENIYFSYPLISDSTLSATTSDLLTTLNLNTFLSSLLSGVVYSDYFAAVQNGFDYSSLYNTETNQKFLNFILSLDLENYLTAKELENICNKYYGIIIDSFSDVSMQDENVTVGDITKKYTVLTARMSIYDTKDIAIRLLEELKNEKFIYAVLADLPIDGINEHTVSGIADILIGQIDKGYNDFISSYFGVNNGDVVLKTYVAPNGKTAGHEYYIDGDITTEKSGYVFAKKGENIEFSAHIASLDIKGFGTVNGGVFSGDVAVNDYIIRVDNFSLIKAAGGIYPKISAKFVDENLNFKTDYNNGMTINLEYDGLKLNLAQKHGEGFTDDIAKENSIGIDTWLETVNTEQFMKLMGQIDEIIPPEDVTSEPTVTTADSPVTTTSETANIDGTTETTAVTTTDITTTANTTDITTSAGGTAETTAPSVTGTATPYNSSTLSLTFNVPAGYNASEEGGQLIIDNSSEMISIDKSVNKFKNAKEISDLFAAAGFGEITETQDNSSVGGQAAYSVTFVDDSGITAHIYYVPAKNIIITVIAGEGSPLLAVQNLITFN